MRRISTKPWKANHIDATVGRILLGSQRQISELPNDLLQRRGGIDLDGGRLSQQWLHRGEMVQGKMDA